MLNMWNISAGSIIILKINAIFKPIYEGIGSLIMKTIFCWYFITKQSGYIYKLLILWAWVLHQLLSFVLELSGRFSI